MPTRGIAKRHISSFSTESAGCRGIRTLKPELPYRSVRKLELPTALCVAWIGVCTAFILPRFGLGRRRVLARATGDRKDRIPKGRKSRAASSTWWPSHRVHRRGASNARELSEAGGPKIPECSRPHCDPATLLRRHRELVAEKWTFPERRRPGRSRTKADIEQLIVRMGTENPNWGYTRI